ncbi:MAG: o-succinylbenzoate synthase [Firmicutes bacterium]|nr:o-succinylbenzoate synthase [Bacillota bacterium]
MRLREPIQTAHGIVSWRPVLLIKIDTSIGKGIGECSALGDPYYSPEYLSVSDFVLKDFLLPHIITLPFPTTLHTILTFFNKLKGYSQAKAAVEMALLDLLTKSQNISLLSFLTHGQPTKTTIPAGMTIGISDDIQNTISAIGDALSKGYRRIKCKIYPAYDMNLVKAIFSAYPNETNLEIFLDANESYSLDRHDLDTLISIGNFDERIIAIEQPIPRDQILYLTQLKKNIGCHLLLDESVSDLLQIATIGELQLGSGIVIKPSRLGGVIPSLAALDLAHQYRLQTSLGGMYEAGIARAVSLAMASLETITLGSDIGPSQNYYLQDITSPHRLRNGYLEIPNTTGLGVRLIDESIFDSKHIEFIKEQKSPFECIYPAHHFFHK